MITALAGRTQHPSEIAGTLRIGGFGGVSGLTNYLREQQIDILLDATHPFAKQISVNAALAVKSIGIPALRVVRPAWTKVEGDRWIEVQSIEAAVEAIPSTAQKVFLAIGRQQLAPFMALAQPWFLLRSIEQPDVMPLKGMVLCDRGPFTLARELQLLREYQIDLMVSKNSGGDATYAKLEAARELDIPVVMIQRPIIPPVEQVSTVAEATAWVVTRILGTGLPI